MLLLYPLAFLADVDGAWLALVGTLFGGAGLKVIEAYLSRSKDKQVVRRDLVEELHKLQERLDLVEDEVTFWRSRYYEEQEDSAKLRILMIQNGLEPPSKVVYPPKRLPRDH